MSVVVRGQGEQIICSKGPRDIICVGIGARSDGDHRGYLWQGEDQKEEAGEEEQFGGEEEEGE